MSQQALAGDVVVMNGGDGTRVRAVARLNATPPLLLMIGRPVDPKILGYMARTEQAVSEYQRLDQSRSWLQIAFAWIFAVVALLVLLAAALIGLVMANQIARPIGTLINATERVRGGDLGVRVTEGRSRDELAGLSRAFNRMTGQLAAQRAELMEAYSQIDGRRRFTETVLAGVSAGVIGLDARGQIELPNRAAAELLAVDLLAAIGRDIAEVVPEFAELIEAARAAPERPRTEEVRIGPPNKPRTLLVRIGAEMTSGRVERLHRHLRRHHRTAVGATQSRLGRRRAPHRARNQEPADADPARRRAVEAPFHQGNNLRSGNVQPVRRYDHPPCRRYRPHGR